MKVQITASLLNVRKEPFGTIISQVNENDILDLQSEKIIHLRNLEWINVIHLGVSAWIAKKYTKPIVSVRSAKLSTNRIITNKDGGAFLYPINDFVSNNDLKSKVYFYAKHFEVIKHLDVENPQTIFTPKRNFTYCNIYAWQYCELFFSHLSDAKKPYMPRVWWNTARHERDGVSAQLGNSVHEQNANAMHDWFTVYGSAFGWQISNDLQAIQDKVNNGQVFAVLIARNKNANRSGHITVLIPNVNGYTQSQAGVANHAIMKNNNWHLLRSLENPIIAYQTIS